MTLILEWARSIKPDLIQLQAKTDIPALFAAAQFCHESAGDGPRGLSELADKAENYAGMKWVTNGWQAAYGCTPIVMGTWEVIDGVDEYPDDAFCACPSWDVWLQVYGDLLTGQRYGPALTLRNDPLLYAHEVWRLGWATDPAYLLGIARWMFLLWPDYQDTLAAIPYPEVPVQLPGGHTIIGKIRANRSYVDVPVKALAELMGGRAEWVPKESGGPRVEIRWP